MATPFGSEEELAVELAAEVARFEARKEELRRRSVSIAQWRSFDETINSSLQDRTNKSSELADMEQQCHDAIVSTKARAAEEVRTQENQIVKLLDDIEILRASVQARKKSRDDEVERLTSSKTRRISDVRGQIENLDRHIEALREQKKNFERERSGNTSVTFGPPQAQSTTRRPVGQSEPNDGSWIISAHAASEAQQVAVADSAAVPRETTPEATPDNRTQRQLPILHSSSDGQAERVAISPIEIPGNRPTLAPQSNTNSGSAVTDGLTQKESIAGNDGSVRPHQIRRGSLLNGKAARKDRSSLEHDKIEANKERHRPSHLSQLANSKDRMVSVAPLDLPSLEIEETSFSSELPMVVYYHGRWRELRCYVCFANKISTPGSGRFFSNVQGLLNHVTLCHGFTERAAMLTKCIMRTFTSEEIEALRSGIQPDPPIELTHGNSSRHNKRVKGGVMTTDIQTTYKGQHHDAVDSIAIDYTPSEHIRSPSDGSIGPEMRLLTSVNDHEVDQATLMRELGAAASTRPATPLPANDQQDESLEDTYASSPDVPITEVLKMSRKGSSNEPTSPAAESETIVPACDELQMDGEKSVDTSGPDHTLPRPQPDLEDEKSNRETRPAIEDHEFHTANRLQWLNSASPLTAGFASATTKASPLSNQIASRKPDVNAAGTFAAFAARTSKAPQKIGPGGPKHRPREDLRVDNRPPNPAREARDSFLLPKKVFPEQFRPAASTASSSGEEKENQLVPYDTFSRPRSSPPPPPGNRTALADESPNSDKSPPRKKQKHTEEDEEETRERGIFSQFLEPKNHGGEE